MAKYIDAEKLIAEINKLRSESCISESDDYYELAKDEILDIITSLQQEQPEVDFSKEFDRYCERIHAWQVQEAPFTSLENCAHHFFNLGPNARKEE